MPPIHATSHFTSSGFLVFSFAQTTIADRNDDGVVDQNDYNFGYYFTLSGNTKSFFPAAASWDGWYAALYGSKAGIASGYWTNSIYVSTLEAQKDSKMAATGLSFFTPAMVGGGCYASANGGMARGDANSVRCVADKE